MKKRRAKKQSSAAKFNLRNTDSFTPAEAAGWLRRASEQLEGFQLWHPQLQLAHDVFVLAGVSYPIPQNTIPKGIFISELDWVANFSAPPPRQPTEYVQPFRATTLSRIAEMSLSAAFNDRERKGCPTGICALALESKPEKGLSLKVQYLHDFASGEKPPEIEIERITSKLGATGRDRWVLCPMDYVVLYRNILRYQSNVEIHFSPGELNELERILKEMFEMNGAPKTAEWRVDFGKHFYSRVHDNAGRYYDFPNPELLKANGLTGDAGELLQLVNIAGFPGKTADLRFYASFDELRNARAFFQLAAQSEKSSVGGVGNGISCSALGMFKTDKGAMAQFCYGTKRNGKIVFKVLYQKRGGFGWEDAYEKLVRGERLFPVAEIPRSP